MLKKTFFLQVLIPNINVCENQQGTLNKKAGGQPVHIDTSTLIPKR